MAQGTSRAATARPSFRIITNPMVSPWPVRAKAVGHDVAIRAAGGEVIPQRAEEVLVVLPARLAPANKR